MKAGEVSLWFGIDNDEGNEAAGVDALRRRCLAAEANVTRLQRENANLRKLAIRLCTSPEV
jgi:hypothetical protein